MIRPGDWVFAVDFGTTNTVAAVGDVHGVRPLSLNGRISMPSAVMLQGHGKWLVGDLAINAARRNLAWFEQAPKSRIRDGSVSLGGHSIPVVDAIAAVLRFVAGEAQKQHGARPPARYVVTHPAGWAGGRIELLLAAARKATDQAWPNPLPLEEPVAAAQGLIDIPDMPSPARIVVLDLGGGTVDVATVDREGPHLVVAGSPDGIDEAGGEDFDLRLARFMADEAGEHGLFDKLRASDNPHDRELALDIRLLARSVKEQLSVDTLLPMEVPVPSRDGPPVGIPVQVSRHKLEELIQGGPDRPPGLTEAVGLVTKARQEAPPGGPPFTGVFLVGGSSRIPLLGRLLQRDIGMTPISRGDPGVAVAVGAAEWAGRSIENGPGPSGGERPASDLFGRLRAVLRDQSPRVLSAVIAALIAVGGVLLLRPSPPSPTPTHPPPPPTTSVAPTANPPTTDGPQAAGVKGCTTAAQADCAAAILATSRSVWPDMPPDGCRANESRYGVDLYSAECRTPTISYDVFWRKPTGSILTTLAGQMMTPTLNDFMLPDSPVKLGTQVGGVRVTASGPRFTCVWEYADYPVTLVLDGPNNDTTVALCGQKTFLDSAAMKSVVAPS
jgi:molecular chaperone DnaK